MELLFYAMRRMRFGLDDAIGLESDCLRAFYIMRNELPKKASLGALES